MKNVELKLTPEVISAIDEELDYISKLSEIGRADKEDYGVEGQLVTLGVYTRRAQEAWTDNPSDLQARDVLRKVSAIAIRALLVYGCPRRNKG